MEKRICNACDIEKSLDSFYNCKGCRQGKMSVCKICRIQGNLANKNKDKVHQFNKDFRRTDVIHYNLAGCTPKDYEMMWEVLEQMGYDCEGNIHQQFLDSMKFKYDVQLKRKKKTHVTTFDKDGKYNGRNKKTPTDE